MRPESTRFIEKLFKLEQKLVNIAPKLMQDHQKWSTVFENGKRNPLECIKWVKMDYKSMKSTKNS